MEGPNRQQRGAGERGSTLVEFTLVLLPMLGFLFMTLDVAWLVFAWASLEAGVREGVRVAVTGQSDATIRSVVGRYSFGFVQNLTSQGPIEIHYLSASNPSVETGSNCPGNVVKIIVQGVMITPMAPIWRSNSPIALSAASADIVEPAPTCVARQ